MQHKRLLIILCAILIGHMKVQSGGDSSSSKRLKIWHNEQVRLPDYSTILKILENHCKDYEYDLEILRQAPSDLEGQLYTADKISQILHNLGRHPDKKIIFTRYDDAVHEIVRVAKQMA